MPKKVYLKNFGCQMNERDSEVIAGLLQDKQWRLTDDPAKADVAILNTCSVRQHAENRVWSAIGSFKKLRHKPIIGVAGCMAQNYKEAIFERAPEVDFVVGPSDIAKIPGIISSFFSAGRQQKPDILLQRKVWETGGSLRPQNIYHTGFYQDREHAFVVISEGCSNYCSYCIVPYVRGPLRNRDLSDILEEIRQATCKGITKITLLGQNVNAWKGKNSEFTGLLEKVNRIDGLKEFSFMSSQPRDTSEALFWAIAGCEKLKKGLHLPVQSGSDRILALMGRGYTRKYYLDLVKKYRRIVVGGKLTTDIIVGFPGESKEDFRKTYDLVRDTGFDSAYIFKYSPRPRTRAASMPDDVALPEKERRHRLILDLQKKISKSRVLNGQPK